MKIWWLFLLPVAAQANENLQCYGVSGLIGPSAQAAMSLPGEGKIDLAKMFRSRSDVSFTDEGFSQRLGSQQVPALGGGVRAANLEYAVALRYDGNRLVGADQRLHETGRPEDVLRGNASEYEWVNGHCRPTKITVRDKALMGQARGVVFDAKLCAMLKKKGLDAKKGEACVAHAKEVFAVMKEYDRELRSATGDSEILVASQPLFPSGLAAIAQSADTGYALQAMASCAEFENSARPVHPSPRPEPNTSAPAHRAGQPSAL